jgi:hypothetical protein
MKMNPSAQTAGARRRQRPRLRVGLTARVETLHGKFDAQLIDLSQSGARLRTLSPKLGRAVVLRWLDFEGFGDLVWEGDGVLGMKFDPPLSSEVILATRELAPSVVQDFDPTRDAAKAWTMGHVR